MGMPKGMVLPPARHWARLPEEQVPARMVPQATTGTRMQFYANTLLKASTYSGAEGRPARVPKPVKTRQRLLVGWAETFFFLAGGT